MKEKYHTTESGQRRYNIEAYLGKHKPTITICYCRVSSPKQRDDLERQVEFMRERDPTAEIIKDIGSGLNYKRKGLLSILERALRGDHIKLVVVHRDRLARFGLEFIKPIIERNGGEFVVLDQTTPEESLTKDLLTSTGSVHCNILHVFSCRLHGLRNYKKQIHQTLPDPRTTEDI